MNTKNMNTKRRPKKLKLGKVYIVWFGSKNNMSICKFVQPTKCGFNFLNLEGNKCILKHHLYPSKCENHQSGDWFWINEKMNINEFDVSAQTLEQKDLMNLLKSFEERLKVLQSKENKDDFINGQIYEATIAIINIQTLYLNNLKTL